VAPALEGRSSAPDLRAEVIRDWAGVSGLAREWNALLRRSRSDSVFLTWEWIDAWRRATRPSGEPFVVVVRDAAGTPAGLGPFYLDHSQLLGALGYRTLRVLGDSHTGAEYLDWIARSDREAEATLAIAATLRRQESWDLLWIPHVSGWTGARERISAACASAGLPHRARPKPFSVVRLPDDFDAYLRGLSGNGRSALSRRSRALRESGAVAERCERRPQLDEYLDALFELHDRRWGTLGGRGLFERDRLTAPFYRRFVPMALARGWLGLYGLRLHGRLAVVQIGLVYRGTFHQLQEGFDPGGVGNVLRSHVIESGIRDGWTAYDFLGGVTEHKRRWRAVVREGYDLMIARGGSRGELATALGLWPTGRYLRLGRNSSRGPAGRRPVPRACPSPTLAVPRSGRGSPAETRKERSLMDCQLFQLPEAGRASTRLAVLAGRLGRGLLRRAGSAARALREPSRISRKLRALAAPASGSASPAPDRRPLDLRPGERVRVRALPEIRTTLDALKRCDGLGFMGLMAGFCGGTYTVRKRVDRFFDERTRRMLRVRDVVILDDAFCQPPREASGDYAGCDRTCFLFWKEAWLERVDAR